MSDFNEICIFSTGFRKKAEMSNLIKMSAVGAELFHADGWTEGYDEANSHFSPFREQA